MDEDADQKSAVAPVSQAWFTTKEDKDTLANKGTALFSAGSSPCGISLIFMACGRPPGHKWKQGMWSKEEINLLMSNIDHYVKVGHFPSASVLR